jgi:hypothetical protein
MDNLIPILTEKIRSKHEKFLGEAGEIPYKVSADYALLLASVTSKISLVVSILKSECVIDVDVPEYFGDYNTFLLSKKGLDFKVKIITNGTSIIMSAYGPINSMDLDKVEQWYEPKKGVWDWGGFANEIVDFIHYTMYRSQKVEEIDIEQLMKEACIND